MQRSPSNLLLRVYIRPFVEKQLDDFLETVIGRTMQRSQSSIWTLRIHIRASSQMLFDGFDVPCLESLVN